MDGLANFSNSDTVTLDAMRGMASPSVSVVHPDGVTRRSRGFLLTVKGGCYAGALALWVACATMPHGAPEANMTRARSGAAQGWVLFKEHCAACHGERGESVSSAPRIMGPGALPEYPRERNINADPASGDPELLRLKAQSRPAGAPWRDPLRTAQDLYSYVRRRMPMPEKSAGSLSAGEYWAIVNFMLLGHGVPVPPEGVNQENAASVKLHEGRP
jgi:mono/diheme cytochrome c family protein